MHVQPQQVPVDPYPGDLAPSALDLCLADPIASFRHHQKHIEEVVVFGDVDGIVACLPLCPHPQFHRTHKNARTYLSVSTQMPPSELMTLYNGG